jgi:hypothetical protein
MRKWKRIRDAGRPFELTLFGAGLVMMTPDGVVPVDSITLTEEMLDAGIKAGIYHEGCFNSLRCEPTPYSGWPDRFEFLKTDYTGFDSRP